LRVPFGGQAAFNPELIGSGVGTDSTSTTFGFSASPFAPLDNVVVVRHK
jgi:hypothetical protein